MVRTAVNRVFHYCGICGFMAAGIYIKPSISGIFIIEEGFILGVSIISHHVLIAETIIMTLNMCNSLIAGVIVIYCDKSDVRTYLIQRWQQKKK